MGEDTADARLRLLEAMAFWRLDVGDGRVQLPRAAAEALAAGMDGPALVELASVYSDVDAADLEAARGRAAIEQGLADALDRDPGRIVVHALSHGVVAGERSERDLTRWVHGYHRHDAGDPLLDELALLDDLLDEGDDAAAGRIGSIAAELVDRDVFGPGPG